jgi:hypothetical protein
MNGPSKRIVLFCLSLNFIFSDISLWESSNASEHQSGLDQLVYRSNIIGTDRRVCNYGGGNTSTKTVVKDFRGRDTEVMYVKGSGSDLASMKADNFTGLRMEDIRPLYEKSEMSDEDMVARSGIWPCNGYRRGSLRIYGKLAKPFESPFPLRFTSRLTRTPGAVLIADSARSAMRKLSAWSTRGEAFEYPS